MILSRHYLVNLFNVIRLAISFCESMSSCICNNKGTNQEKSRVVLFIEVFWEKSQNSVLLETFPNGTE